MRTAATLSAPATFKLCFLFFSDVTDLGWTYNYNIARLDLLRRLELDYPTTAFTVQTHTGVFFMAASDRAALIDRLATTDKCNAVLANSQFITPTTARKHPHVSFISAKLFVPELPAAANLVEIGEESPRAFYFMGIAAAHQTTTKSVCMLAAHPPPKTAGQAAVYFQAGVRHVSTTHQIHVVTIGSWFNPTAELLAVNELMTKLKCDVVARYSDPFDVDKLIAKLPGKNVTSMGTHIPLQHFVGDTALTSARVSWAPSLIAMVKRVLDHGSLNVTSTIADAVMEPVSVVAKSHVAPAVEHALAEWNNTPASFRICGAQALALGVRLVDGNATPVDSDGCLDVAALNQFTIETAQSTSSNVRGVSTSAATASRAATKLSSVDAVTVDLSTFNGKTTYHSTKTFADGSKCPARTFYEYDLGGPGGVLRLQCRPCPANTYRPLSQTSAGPKCTACAAGTTSVVGSSECTVESTTSTSVVVIAAVVVLGAVVVVLLVSVLGVMFARYVQRSRIPRDESSPFAAFFVSIKNESAVRDVYGSSVDQVFMQCRRVVVREARAHGCHPARHLDAHHLVVATDADRAFKCAIAIEAAMRAERWPIPGLEKPSAVLIEDRNGRGAKRNNGAVPSPTHSDLSTTLRTTARIDLDAPRTFGGPHFGDLNGHQRSTGHGKQQLVGHSRDAVPSPTASENRAAKTASMELESAAGGSRSNYVVEHSSAFVPPSPSNSELSMNTFRTTPRNRDRNAAKTARKSAPKIAIGLDFGLGTIETDGSDHFVYGGHLVRAAARHADLAIAGTIVAPARLAERFSRDFNTGTKSSSKRNNNTTVNISPTISQNTSRCPSERNNDGSDPHTLLMEPVETDEDWSESDENGAVVPLVYLYTSAAAVSGAVQFAGLGGAVGVGVSSVISPLSTAPQPHSISLQDDQHINKNSGGFAADRKGVDNSSGTKSGFTSRRGSAASAHGGDQHRSQGRAGWGSVARAGAERGGLVAALEQAAGGLTMRRAAFLAISIPDLRQSPSPIARARTHRARLVAEICHAVGDIMAEAKAAPVSCTDGMLVFGVNAMMNTSRPGDRAAAAAFEVITTLQSRFNVDAACGLAIAPAFVGEVSWRHPHVRTDDGHATGGLRPVPTAFGTAVEQARAMALIAEHSQTTAPCMVQLTSTTELLCPQHVVDVVTLPRAADSRRVAVAAVLPARNLVEDEWMYQLQQATSGHGDDFTRAVNQRFLDLCDGRVPAPLEHPDHKNENNQRSSPREENCHDRECDDHAHIRSPPAQSLDDTSPRSSVPPTLPGTNAGPPQQVPLNEGNDGTFERSRFATTRPHADDPVSDESARKGNALSMFADSVAVATAHHLRASTHMNLSSMQRLEEPHSSNFPSDRRGNTGVVATPPRSRQSPRDEELWPISGPAVETLALQALQRFGSAVVSDVTGTVKDSKNPASGQLEVGAVSALVEESVGKYSVDRACLYFITERRSSTQKSAGLGLDDV